ncbi:DUF397 domain-containing protein [Saccharopolyspora hattusasensis]|uniref:DUF397 domain-containing protein n=1 Tax=Saccharopolyspora hattusasensis TaxID=1128679 RepID=UPI003D988018
MIRTARESNACVEVRLTDQAVAVRDSKAPGDGQIVVSHAAWRGFLSKVEQGFGW